jgi:hypothetical protein
VRHRRNEADASFFHGRRSPVLRSSSSMANVRGFKRDFRSPYRGRMIRSIEKAPAPPTLLALNDRIGHPRHLRGDGPERLAAHIRIRGILASFSARNYPERSSRSSGRPAAPPSKRPCEAARCPAWTAAPAPGTAQIDTWRDSGRSTSRTADDAETGADRRPQRRGAHCDCIVAVSPAGPAGHLSGRRPSDEAADDVRSGPCLGAARRRQLAGLTGRPEIAGTACGEPGAEATEVGPPLRFLPRPVRQVGGGPKETCMVVGQDLRFRVLGVVLRR